MLIYVFCTCSFLLARGKQDIITYVKEWLFQWNLNTYGWLLINLSLQIFGGGRGRGLIKKVWHGRKDVLLNNKVLCCVLVKFSLVLDVKFPSNLIDIMLGYRRIRWVSSHNRSRLECPYGTARRTSWSHMGHPRYRRPSGTGSVGGPPLPVPAGPLGRQLALP